MSEAIPGTFVMPTDLQWRQVDPPCIPDAEHVCRYIAKTGDGTLSAICGFEGRLWHLSVATHCTPRRLPTWDELKHAKYTLVPIDVPMVLEFPKKTGPYVNVHETTLHLWESKE